MNYRQIIRQLGVLVLLVGACMSSSLVWAFIDRHEARADKVIFAIVASMVVCLILGVTAVLLGRGSRTSQEMYRKEAIAVVGVGWLLCGLLGALPYILSGVLTGLYDGWFDICASAAFESISGFTTTGASIFPAPEYLPRAILFWRSLTHWLGGMGIVVLFVAILGQIGSSAKFLFSSEVPGPLAESIKPRIRQTALLLWKIYVAISAAEVICLMLGGMNVFESLCHTFGTMATGGFSTRNASIGQYQHLGFEITIIVFMVLAGTNFNLYAAILHGQWRSVLKDHEWRVYLLLLLGAVGLISLDLIFNRPLIYTGAEAIRTAAFQAVSIMTTTGYCTDDFDKWPSFSRWLLIVLMFIGGSAGSTGGGIKVIRIMLFMRLALLEVEQTFRPNVVRPLTIGRRTLDDSVRRNVSAYIGIVLIIFFTATVLLLVCHNDSRVPDKHHLDLETAFSAVAATLNNIGPGLNMVGATQNYAFFTAPAKILLSLLMILGRLEIMVILCLLVPSFWRRR